MSHSARSFGRDLPPLGRSGSSLQNERERERKRREQQFVKLEQSCEEPVFSQPRKVTTTRQDSLTRNINNVLGDSGIVQDILFRGEPNIWLGTSRGSQGPATPAPPPPTEDAPLYPSSNQVGSAAAILQKTYANSQKRGTPGSTNMYHQTSRPPASSNTHRNHTYTKSRDEAGRSSYLGHKQSQDAFGRSRHNNHLSPTYLAAEKRREDASHKHGGAPFTSNDLPISRLNDVKTLSSKLDGPGRIQDRDRVPSIDSDMLGGVENILKEMTEEVPIEPLTEIKTPNVGESKFNFSNTKRRLAGPESSLESPDADVVGEMAASSSSEDDSSDEESDNNNNASDDETSNNNANKWNLEAFKPPQPNSILPASNTLEAGPASSTKSPKTSGASDAKNDDQRLKASRNRTYMSDVSLMGKQGSHHPSGTQPGGGRSSARGRDSGKTNSPKRAGRQRSSSSSSQRSASRSSHRSTSSDKRAVPTGHETVAQQSRLSGSQNKHPDIDAGGRKIWEDTSGVGRNTSKSSKSKQSMKKDSTGSNPSQRRGGVTNVSKSPRQLEAVEKNYDKSKNSPRVQISTPDRSALEPSAVTKQTISSTKTIEGSRSRHSVGRKGPRVSDKNKIGPPTSANHKTSTGLSDCSSSSGSESSDDDENDFRESSSIKEPAKTPLITKKQESDSESPSDSSSDSDSESSSDSDSDSEPTNLDKKLSCNPTDPKAPSTQVSWNLNDFIPKENRSSEIVEKPKKSNRTVNPPPLKDPKPATSPYGELGERKPKSQHHDSVPRPPKEKTKRKVQQKCQPSKKPGRKSAPGSLVPIVHAKQDVAPPPVPIKKEPSTKPSSKSHDPSRNGTPARQNQTTVDEANLKSSSDIAKKRRKDSKSSTKGARRHSTSNSDRQHLSPRVTNPAPLPEMKPMSPETKQNVANYPSLWVSIKAKLLGKEVADELHFKNPGRRSAATLDLPTSPLLARKASKSPDKKSSLKRSLTTVSTGSETEQPARRADSVQVAVPDRSTDWMAGTPVQSSKRKLNSAESAYDEVPQSTPGSQKRRKRDKSSSRHTSPRSNSSSPWQQDRPNRPTRSPPGEHWRETPVAEETPGNPPSNHQSNHRYHNRTPNSRTTPRRESPTSNNNATCQPSRHSATAGVASIVLPDSSVPEQERIQTSDYYMREGKRIKRGGDDLTDMRTGRTRPGEALNRALAYFEASLFFVMSGYVMETENSAERSDISSNSGSSSSSHCPTNMYQETIQFLIHILKMRPHIEQQDRVFKRIMISCIRCQAVLYYRIFKLKKDGAGKYSELLTDQFKSMSKSNRTPSPWHHTHNNAPNVVSPLSPAVTSPFGHPGPSPVSSNGEQVTSSTQAGKMTPPSHGGLVFPQKTYDIYRQQHAIMCLIQAHEKWDQSEAMLEGHNDFFRNIDTLCGRNLTFHTSLRDVFLYHRVVLHQLQTLTSNSPRE